MGAVLLILLTLVGLDAIYWLLFCIWRSAAEPANTSILLPRIYEWLAITIVAGVAWIALLVRTHSPQEKRILRLLGATSIFMPLGR